jgi:DeoR/GlpR family transcriptional regulator of sugar metabolism
MLAQQRRTFILEHVRLHGAVRVSELTEALGVSDMTVRRDLETLAARGMLEKVHGGATAIPQHSTDEPGFEAKSSLELGEKEGIAARAASLVQPGTAIAISAGTTTWALARQLGDVPQLTVVTNSISVAEILYRIGRPDQTVVLTGGMRTRSNALVGPVAVSALRNLHVDLLFMGVHGMDERRGFTTPNLMEADTNRALMEAARRVVVVADHTKWGVVGLSSIAALDEADILITDEGLPAEAQAALEENVGELIVTPTVATSGSEAGEGTEATGEAAG